jgi:hypothetical protein
VYQSAGDCLEDDVAGTEDSRQAEEQENPGRGIATPGDRDRSWVSGCSTHPGSVRRRLP